MEEEIWKIYKKTQRTIWEVSNYGQVKRNGEIYQCKPSNRGYLMFSCYYLHKAVAQCFIPNPNNYNEVDHIDGNRQNNFYLNLRWCSHKQNMNNPITRNRLSESKKGENHPMYGRKGEKNPRYGVHHSEETKSRLSEVMKGKKHSQLTKNKISSVHKGKVLSEDHKEKLSNAFKGRSWFVGSDGKRHWQ